MGAEENRNGNRSSVLPPSMFVAYNPMNPKENWNRKQKIGRVV